MENEDENEDGGMNIMGKCSYNLNLIKCEKLFTIYPQPMCITSLLHHFTALKRIIHIRILGIKILDNYQIYINKNHLL